MDSKLNLGEILLTRRRSRAAPQKFPVGEVIVGSIFLMLTGLRSRMQDGAQDVRSYRIAFSPRSVVAGAGAGSVDC